MIPQFWVSALGGFTAIIDGPEVELLIERMIQGHTFEFSLKHNMFLVRYCLFFKYTYLFRFAERAVMFLRWGYEHTSYKIFLNDLRVESVLDYFLSCDVKISAR